MSTNPLYFLGVDGGGTKTEAAIIDANGNVLGTGVGGPSNYDDVGVEVTMKNIGRAVDGARAEAGLPTRPFAAAFLGMAGVVSSKDREAIGAIAGVLRLAPPERIGVDHDCRIALAGGLSGRPGIVLIAGTGSSCFGMNEQGESWRAGGWGSLISDEGSSYWLGVKAIQVATMAYDGRLPHTLLLDMVQSHLGLPGMDDLLHKLYVEGMSRAQIAEIAPLVVDAARAGDEQACSLIEQGTVALADCVLAVARRLGLEAMPCELALVGGLLSAGEVVTAPLEHALAERLPMCKPKRAELSPVLGAALLAARQSGSLDFHM